MRYEFHVTVLFITLERDLIAVLSEISKTHVIIFVQQLLDSWMFMSFGDIEYQKERLKARSISWLYFIALYNSYTYVFNMHN